MCWNQWSILRESCGMDRPFLPTCSVKVTLSLPSLSVAIRNLTPLKPSKASCSLPPASAIEASSNGSVLVKKFSSRPRSSTVSPMAATSRTAASTGNASSSSSIGITIRTGEVLWKVEADHRRLRALRQGARGGGTAAIRFALTNRRTRISVKTFRFCIYKLVVKREETLLGCFSIT